MYCGIVKDTTVLVNLSHNTMRRYSVRAEGSNIEILTCNYIALTIQPPLPVRVDGRLV